MLNIQSYINYDDVIVIFYVVSCDGFYPLYNEDLFPLDAIITIAYTLRQRYTNSSARQCRGHSLYHDRHDGDVANVGEVCDDSE